MTKKDKLAPHQFLRTLREAIDSKDPRPLNCFGVFRVLKLIWPDAVPYYNGNHVVTKINGTYYDIDGEVLPNFIEMTEEDQMKAEKWTRLYYENQSY